VSSHNPRLTPPRWKLSDVFVTTDSHYANFITGVNLINRSFCLICISINVGIFP
jgi:hypothetical protein